MSECSDKLKADFDVSRNPEMGDCVPIVRINFKTFKFPQILYFMT